MKKIVRFMCVFALVSYGSALSLGDEPSGIKDGGPVAESGPSGKKQLKREMIANLLLGRELLLQKYDVNKDGQLDEGEKEALLHDAREVRNEGWKKLLERFDVDGDGKLSEEERRNMREFLKKRRSPEQEIKEKGISIPPPPNHRQGAEGKKNGKREGVRRHAGGKMMEVRPSVFLLLQSLIMQKYDLNQNGKLDPEEYEQLKKDADLLYTDKINALVSRYDEDGDGVLNEKERQSARSGIVRDTTRVEEEEVDLDDIDRFIRNSFEEELIELLEKSSVPEETVTTVP